MIIKHSFSVALSVVFVFCLVGGAIAEDFDPLLHPKANDYQEWTATWHHQDLGGLAPTVSFTDDSQSELACVHGTGDSMIWTGMYLGSQALRYMITKDPDAHDEMAIIIKYMHDAMAITGTRGYLPRYAGHDYMPYNCGYQGEGHDWKNQGVGQWEGYFWVDHTSRDQYSGYMWGMSLAYEALADGSKDDEGLRDVIREAMIDIIWMLEGNLWNITDQNGEYTGNNAAWIAPGGKRLAWVLTAASIIDEPYYWELLDREFEKIIPILALDASGFLNRYTEYFGNNLRHLDFQAIFRLWPDKKRLEQIWEVWLKRTRPWVANTNNAWYDAVHITGCVRLGACSDEEIGAVAADVQRALTEYWDPPSHARMTYPPELPLDPLSVWLSELDLPEILPDIHPQTLQAHRVKDRCWDDMIWQRSPFSISCGQRPEDLKIVCSGMPYLVAYWMGVYTGLLDGGGPYVDTDFGDPDDDDYSSDDDQPSPGDEPEPEDDDQSEPDVNENSSTGCGC